MAQAKIRNADINASAAIDRTKLASGTANQVIVNDGTGAMSGLTPSGTNTYLSWTGAAWAMATPATGLTNWTEAVNTAAPNATVPVVSLTATNAAANVDAALVSKGTGATTAHIANSLSSGGNKRGNYATDWGKSRNDPTWVASGLGSVVSGGVSVGASGSYSSVGGGEFNLSSGTHSGVPSGKSNTASGNYSFATNQSNTASGINSFATGNNSVADGGYSAVIAGNFSTVRGVTGKVVTGYGITNRGDSQSGSFVCSRTTTDATATTLTATAAAASTTNTNVLPDSGAYVVRARVVARQAATADTKAWEIVALVKRGAGVATTAVVGATSVTMIAADAGAAAWTANIVADTTNGAAIVQVTGEAAKTIRWVATMETTEVA